MDGEKVPLDILRKIGILLSDTKQIHKEVVFELKLNEKNGLLNQHN